MVGEGVPVLLRRTARQDFSACQLPVIHPLFLQLHHNVLLEKKNQLKLAAFPLPFLYLILVPAFSFRHLGHLQTDNMSLQFVLVPWSSSVDQYRVFAPPHLC